MVEFIRSHPILTEMGNYDDGVGFDQDDRGCALPLFGHIHLLYQKSAAGVLFVNAGPAAKPKDDDRRAGDVLLELARGSRIHFHRVARGLAVRAIRPARRNAQAELLEPEAAPAQRAWAYRKAAPRDVMDVSASRPPAAIGRREAACYNPA